MRDAPRLKRLLPYAVVAAATGFLYAAAADIRYPARAGVLGPDFWPKLILALMLAVCAWKIASALLWRGHGEDRGVLEEWMETSAAGHDGPPDEPAPERRFWRLAGGIALSVAYVWALPRLGFFGATAPYLAAFIALGGYRRLGALALLSVGGTLLLLFFFMKVVYVSLPLGQGPFQQLTLALMQLMGIR